MPAAAPLRYLGVVPARGGSKGVPGKNMVDLGGRPLLAWTLEAAAAAQRLDRAVLTSDDEDAIVLAREHGVDAPFVRPAELATDGATLVDTVLHALEHLRETDGADVETVVLLQPTSPFRDAADVDAAIEAFEQSGADSLVAVVPVDQHPSECVRPDGAGGLHRALALPEGGRRQDFEPYYYVNGAIYVVRAQHLREARTFQDDRSALHVMTRSHSVDIDDLFDLALARALLAAEPG